MGVFEIIVVSIGAAIGACVRWGLGLALNPIFPTIPLGTLAANIIGCFLMGIFMALIREYAFIPPVVRLAIATGFLGGLTTFSTFSAEAVTLFSFQEYLWLGSIVLAHVAGSLLATILGIYTIKLFLSY